MELPFLPAPSIPACIKSSTPCHPTMLDSVESTEGPLVPSSSSSRLTWRVTQDPWARLTSSALGRVCS